MSVLVNLLVGLALMAGQAETKQAVQGVVYCSTDGIWPLTFVGAKKRGYKGALLDVERDGKHVGRLRITEVYPDDSVADIVEDVLGIRGGDSVRLVTEHHTLEQRGKPAEIQERTGLEGILLNSYSSPDPSLILISIGKEQGVYEGALFEVLRDGQHVGKLRVVRAFPTVCECKIVDRTKLGFRPQDVVRLIPEGAKVKPVGRLNNWD